MSNRGWAQNRKQAEGFTLIEMMVSVTLIVLIALSLWGAMRICIATWKRGTESMDENQRHRATLDLVQKQMSSISNLVPPVDLQTGAGQAPVFLGSPTSVQFISLCPLRFSDNPGLTSVSYDVVPGDNGEYQLVEREGRYLGGDPTLAAGSEDASAPATVIFDHLTSASFEYWDPGNQETPPQWVTDWSAQEQLSLPTAISLTVNSRDTNGVIHNRKVIIPIMAEPDAATAGFSDPFETQMGGYGVNPFMGRRGGGGPPGRRGNVGGNPPPGGRRGGPGFGGPQPPPGGRRGGDPFSDPRQGRGRGGRF